MRKICFITAVPGSAYSFLKDHMSELRKQYKVYYVSSEPDESKILVSHDSYHCVNIQRNISIIKDIKALWNLFKYFKKERFDAVHSVTPKAGLLTAIAGFFARVPVRIHSYTGQVWANKKGFLRCLLKTMDKLIALFATNILVDGEGQRQFLIKNGVIKSKNSLVLGSGSICGVNLDRFSPSKDVRMNARAELNIPEEKVVFVFMGRLNHDKGVYDLLAAFDEIASNRDDVYLLLFGNDEERVSDKFIEYPHLITGVNFKYYGATNQPHNMLQAGDVFVLPTYREGFGSSVIEASALGLPVICSDAYGVMDAMVDNVTGLRCNVADVMSLNSAMLILACDENLRRDLGENGRKRVMKEFDAKKVTNLWVDYYKSLFFE